MRIKRSVNALKKRRAILKQAKGYWGARSKLYRVAKQAVAKSGRYAYIGRKQKKRQFRALWITRISAACKQNNISYSRFMFGLKLADINLNRKFIFIYFYEIYFVRGVFILTSMQNVKIKEFKRQKNDKFLLFLDTPKLIEEACLAGFVPKIIFVDDEKKEKIFNDFNIFSNNSFTKKCFFVSSNIIASLADVKTPQGIVALFEYPELELKLPSNNFLVLDTVQDAGNVGTLLRSAVGAGFNDVYLLDCAKINNIKLIRSSMGAIFKLNIFQTSKNDFIDLFNFKNNSNYKLFGCDMLGQNIFKINHKILTNNFGIVLGNEGTGLSLEIKNICDNFLSVPMLNNLESLNVAVAGSIIMFYLQFINDKI